MAVCAGCAARRTGVGNYRLAGLYLLPPDSPKAPFTAPQMTVPLGDLGPMPVEQDARACTIHDRWFSLEPRKAGTALVWTATLPLPAAWRDLDLIDNGRSEWDRFFVEMSDLQKKGCLSGSGYRVAAGAIAESMPAPVMYALFFRYSFSSEGYIKLKPGMRLFIERSIFRDEAGDTTKVSNYLGERKVYYDVLATRDSGVALKRQAERRSKGLSARAGAEYPDTGLAHEFRGMQSLRLFVLTLFVPPNVHRNSVLIGVRDPSQMVRLTRVIERDPEIPCGQLESQDIACASFGGVVSASAEIGVRINGHQQYFPIGSTIKTALANVPQPARVSALQSLRIERLFRGAYCEVDFKPGNPELPTLALFPGDRISWRATP